MAEIERELDIWFAFGYVTEAELVVVKHGDWPWQVQPKVSE